MHYWVPCAINKRGFFEIAFKFCHRHRHTFALLWGACLRFASLWRSNSCGDSCVLKPLLRSFIVFVNRSSFKSLLNLCKVYTFQEFAEGLLSICVCWIFQNVHLSKVSAAIVPQTKSTEMWARRCRFIMTCDTFDTEQTNILGLCYSEKLINSPQ